MFLSHERHIAHLDLDAFYVSVECLRNPKLLGKPVIVGGSGDRGVVVSCSYEARKFGVHSGMPIKAARRLCPEVLCIRGDMDAYSRFSNKVTEIVKETVPLFERASIDEFYIDLTGMDKYFGCNQFTSELKRKVMRESGLPVSYGLASSKLISKVATNEVKPNGQKIIEFGKEKEFLAPLSIVKLPGIGKQTAFILLQRGVETIKVLSEIPVEMLKDLLGRNGVDLWRKANAIDESLVIPYAQQKGIGHEETFQIDSINMNFLRSKIVRMTEQVAYKLRSQNRLAGCITVKLRYSDMQTFTRQKTIPYTNADHKLIPVASELFEKLYERRMLIRLLGVRLTNLIPGNYQINLFDDRDEDIRLYQAIDSVKRRFGEEFIIRGAALGK